MVGPIAKLRARMGMPQAALADLLGINNTELSQYERGWQPLTVPLTRDMAIALDCGVSDVLGAKIPVEDWQTSPYAAGAETLEELEPYGDFGFVIGNREFTFPISTRSRLGLLNQLHKRRVGEMEESLSWFVLDTLDNRMIFLNPAFAKRCWLRSDDDEAISYYTHPEVYRALDDLDEPEGWGPVLSKAVKQHCDRVGEEAAEAQAQRMYLHELDGSEYDLELYVGDDAMVTDLIALDAHSFHIERNSYLLTDQCGYHVAEFVNLSQVSCIMVPKERFLRRSAPDDVPANDTDFDPEPVPVPKPKLKRAAPKAKPKKRSVPLSVSYPAQEAQVEERPSSTAEFMKRRKQEMDNS